jgi:hypothetical protein
MSNDDGRFGRFGSADPSAASGALIAVKERRTQVIASLSHAFARDDLDVDELDRRLELAHHATTVAELDALVLDVAPVASRGGTSAVTVRSLAQLGAPSAHGAVSTALTRVTDRPERQTMLSVMGGVERSGRWTVPTRVTVHCLMGGVSLDFREADLAPGVTELSVLCMMGGVEIIVPPNIQVEVSGSAILGGFDQAHPGADPLSLEPVATLRITGVALAGGVGVETRRVGESSRQARKRIKTERKLLSDGVKPGQAALPAAVALPERKRR